MTDLYSYHTDNANDSVVWIVIREFVTEELMHI